MYRFYCRLCAGILPPNGYTLLQQDNTTQQSVWVTRNYFRESGWVPGK